MQHSSITPIDSLCASEISPPRYIDCYDRAVAILTRRPGLIYRSWEIPDEPDEKSDLSSIRYQRERKLTDYCHCLFGFAATDRNNCSYGCLTLIASGVLRAETSDLTQAIYSDHRLPRHGTDITPDHLPLFAGWHRNRIDPALNRKPLPMRVGG